MQEVTTQLLASISSRIVEAICPEKIVLFGSYAWGKPHKDSDIDLFVVVDSSDEPEYRRARAVYRCLRDISIPIDVIVKTHDEVKRSAMVVSSLTKKVLDEGTVLYG